METRIAVFVDGSNLLGRMRDLGFDVLNYEDFFRYVIERGTKAWQSCQLGTPPPVRLLRVYWYVVGSMDEWDLSDPHSQETLRGLFFDGRSEAVRSTYMETVGRELQARNQGTGSDQVASEAFRRFLRDREEWQDDRVSALDGMKRFHYGVESSTDFIEMRQRGHWKLDFLSRSCIEKGLDVSLAVDMVTMVDHYDIALLISGDADMLPSIRHAKNAGRQVGVVEFVRGHPPEKTGRGFSSKLRVETDFVLRVYETDLEREEFAARR